jgi:hypothetical protein
MGMSTHIEAFTPDTDAEYQKHKKIWDLCEQSNVSLPQETKEYFKGCDQVEERLEIELIKGQHYDDWNRNSSEGIEVDLTKLPKGVTKLRFYNAW